MMQMADEFQPPHPLNTAVLFLVFNRLGTTKQVFEAIREAKPPRLYIAADGARENKEGEAEKAESVRKFILESIDWECEVKTLFREKNLGCKYAVSGAITWFFEQEEQGIILEDDCLPSQSFFWFCESLLNRYKNDLRIWHISGDNFQDKIKRGSGSYYFSKFNHIWGWATWRNRWAEYDVKMGTFEKFSKEKKIGSLFYEKKDQIFWEAIFNKVYGGKIDTWDYQWTYAVLINNGVSILPNENLVSNIGFGPDATHTKSLDSIHSKIQRVEIKFPMVDQVFVFPDNEADKYTSDQMFNNPSYIVRALRKVLRMFK